MVLVVRNDLKMGKGSCFKIFKISSNNEIVLLFKGKLVHNAGMQVLEPFKRQWQPTQLLFIVGRIQDVLKFV